MSSHCSQPDCNGGNCPGCDDGILWCQDPRCSPHCRECEPQPDNEFAVNITTAIILICLIFTLVVVWFGYGPTLVVLHNDSNRVYGSI